MEVTLKINGKPVKVTVAPDEMLLETLRGLGYYSVRCGCDTTNCGLCTVWLDGETVLSVKNFGRQGEFQDISLDVKRGEVVGIYGLMGAGRTELFECLFGLRPEATGDIHLNGEKLAGLSIAERIRKGLFLVPEDRQRDGLMQNLSVLKNMSISSLWQFRRGIAIQQKHEATRIDEMIKALRVKVSAPDVEVTALSGGNQQKAMLARWIATEPKMLILDEPTRGIDVAAKLEIMDLVKEQCRKGLAILFISSEMPEVLRVSDTIAVLRDRQKIGEILGDDADEQKVFRMIAGVES